MKNNHRENLSEPDGQERSLGETIRLTYKSEKKPAFRHSNRKSRQKEQWCKSPGVRMHMVLHGQRKKTVRAARRQERNNRTGDGKLVKW